MDAFYERFMIWLCQFIGGSILLLIAVRLVRALWSLNANAPATPVDSDDRPGKSRADGPALP